MTLLREPASGIFTRSAIGRPGLQRRLLWRMSVASLRQAMRQPARIPHYMRQALSAWRQGGLDALQQRLIATAYGPKEYECWVAFYDTMSRSDRTAIRSCIGALSCRPLISILMPVHDASERALLSAIDSVRGQLYEHWELCIAGEAAAARALGAVLDRLGMRADVRIKTACSGEHSPVSAAADRALTMADGEFVAVVDCHDRLAAHSLYMAVEELQTVPDADIIYSDEDTIDESGRRSNPWFKSDWNPDLFLAQDAIGGLCLCRTSLVRAAGGFRPAYEGSHHYDLVLRVSERTEARRIRHIPCVLYHRAAIAVAAARGGYDGAVAATTSVEDHVRRAGIAADVLPVPGTRFRQLRYRLTGPEPPVSVIVPTKDRLDLLRRCVAGVLSQTDYANLELLIIDNCSEQPATKAFLQEISGDARVRIIDYPRPFNYSAINNFAVRQARGDVMLLLNNDTEVISGRWLTDMVANAVRPEVGAVGARLLYPDGKLQHVGTIIGMGFVAGHVHSGLSGNDPGYFGRAMLQQNLSAVTAACLAIRKEVFEEAGGFDEELRVAFNDVDLCLRIRQKGYLIVYTPLAELYHHESASRGSDLIAARRLEFEREMRLMAQRWTSVMANDPYYSPNLSLLQACPVPAFPPRWRYPWRERTKSDAAAGNRLD